MSKRRQTLRALVSERLTAAAEEIFALVERTIAEYEEELCRSKEENQRRQQLLEEVLNPQVLLHRTDVRPPATDPAVPDDDDDNDDDNDGVDDDAIEEGAPVVKQEPADLPEVKEEPDFWEPELTLTPDLEFSHIKPQTFMANFSWQPPIDEECPEPSREEAPLLDDLTQSISQKSQNKSDEDLNLEQNFPNTQMADGEGPSMIPCQICGKKWPTFSTMRRHMNIHFLKKIYGCPICGRKFPREDSMKFHLALHTGEVSAECRICRKGFARKSSLTLHMATHNKVKPFRCSICNKHFTQKGNLKVHMMSHTGERPFRCPHCDCAYLRKERLQKHLLEHNTQRLVQQHKTQLHI